MKNKVFCVFIKMWSIVDFAVHIIYVCLFTYIYLFESTLFTSLGYYNHIYNKQEKTDIHDSLSGHFCVCICNSSFDFMFNRCERVYFDFARHSAIKKNLKVNKGAYFLIFSNQNWNKISWIHVFVRFNCFSTGWMMAMDKKKTESPMATTLILSEFVCVCVFAIDKKIVIVASWSRLSFRTQNDIVFQSTRTDDNKQQNAKEKIGSHSFPQNRRNERRSKAKIS